jgi:glycosyltransferase involved in cell wall biosynthesis
MKKVTILIPCYNEEGSLDALYEALKELMDSQTDYSWEVLMVNDGSKDRTIDIIKQLREKDKRICYVNLSRNFGKENAMLAGFDYATGDCMVIMDADLQHPPMTISDMLAKWEEGYEDVYAKRITRGKESWFRKQFSLFYYRMLKHLTRVEILENVGDFRLLDRKCIDALKNLRETQRYTKGMYCWIGFRKTEVWFEQGDRLAGESSFNFLRLLNLAIDGITSFTTAPLRIATIMGLFVSLIAFVFMCYILLTTLIWGDPVQGYPTLITVILFLGGVQLLSLGIIGEYLGRIFYETKGRPVYVVSEVEGVE